MFTTKETKTYFGEIDQAFENMDDLFKDFNETMDSVFGYKGFVKAANQILSFPTPLPSFPPINVYAEKAQTATPGGGSQSELGDYIVEVAVSGYKQEDVKVTMGTFNAVNFVTVTSAGRDSNATYGDLEKTEWFKRGIAARAFTFRFAIAHNVKVKSADLADGLLKIRLQVELPTSQVKDIPINADCPDCGYAPGERGHPTPASGVSPQKATRDTATDIPGYKIFGN